MIVSNPQTSRRFPHLVIRASAGSGKTFQLSNRFLALLNEGASAEQILATTFTRKAAGEILDRVLVRLAQAALDDGFCRELGEFLRAPSLTRQRCLELLEGLVRNLHRLRVSTLDSFFAQIARSFSLELGLPPGWRIVDELEDARLRSEAIEAVLRQDLTRDLVTLVSLLTKGEASRSVSQLLRETVNDLYGMFLETTADAWRSLPHPRGLNALELAETLEQLRSFPFPDHRSRTARDADYERAAAADWPGFLKTGLANKVLSGENAFHRKPIPAAAVGLYEKLIAHAKSVLIGRVAMQTEATYQLLERFHAEYQRLKHERRALRFEDITRQLAERLCPQPSGALENRQAKDQPTADVADAPSGHGQVEAAKPAGIEQLTFRLDSCVDHLLLDEFQDTAPSQWRVVRPFAERVTAGDPGRSFFCVGDVKQAIYGWRGGVAEIFHAIGRHLRDLQADSLNQSYRSAKPVIETVNRIFCGIVQHTNLGRVEPAVRRWRQQFTVHSTARSELPGYASLAAAPLPSNGESRSEATLRYAAQRVAETVEQAPGCSVGVLVRRNQVVGRLIYELRARGVPASEEGGNPLTDSAAVQVALSLLRMADHPGDSVARFHLAHSPLGAALGLDDHRDEAAARRIAQQVRRSLVEHGYGPSVRQWAKLLAPSANRRELNRLEQLVELAYAYQTNATLRARDFIAHVESQKVSDPSTADVRVMTIHQAKGLQFDVVVLPELDAKLIGQPDSFVVHRTDPAGPVERVCRYANAEIQKLLPREIQHMFEEAARREASESLCVLYVALTRAVHALHMIIAPSAPNERRLPQSYSGLLRAGLTDGQPGPPETTLYEHGDPRWFERRVDKRKTAAAAEHVGSLPVMLAPVDGGRRRGLDRTSPSLLEGGSRVGLAQVFSSSSRERTAALQRGALVHAWLEQIQWLDDGLPDDETLRRVARQTPDISLDPDQLTRLIQQFYAMLDAPQIAAALSRSAYHEPRELGLPAAVLAESKAAPLRLEVENERRFAVRDGDCILSGSIDRLVLMYCDDRLAAADVVDFKTDAAPPETLSAKVDFYRPQVDAYRRAAAKLTGLAAERIAARLLFVGPGIVRSLS